jgi:DNA (cytosine-5)-methyltransferase 1
MSFKFIDLFAGIGGFHAALSALGGECVYASEIDRAAARVYLRNWGIEPDGDITLAANDDVMEVPNHDVLVGGFPCQPFSKSGKQKGMDEARGTLFWNIAKIIEVRKPKIVLLENVRNIAGPRHIHEWDVIIHSLRELGYRVSSEPFIVSPHRIQPHLGGRPQVRERVFIAATRLNRKLTGHLFEEPGIPNSEHFAENWDPQRWNLVKDLPIEKLSRKSKQTLELSWEERSWIDAWEDFVELIKMNNGENSIPGFPIWVDAWVDENKLKIPAGTPQWKENFLRKNSHFYSMNKKILNEWLKRHAQLKDFPPSRRKFEWQAQDAKKIADCILHFRPSGIRVKKATYTPALVAMTQTTILGKQRRRISVREAARLQGFPEWFDFLEQREGVSYKQLGNAVNIGAVYNVLKALVIRDLDLLSDYPELTKSILGAPASPDDHLAHFGRKVDEKTDVNTDLKIIKVIQ